MNGETHRELREQLGAYALGQLDGDRWHAVHRHLEVCARCSAELEHIGPVAGLLAEAAGRLDPDRLTGPTAPADADTDTDTDAAAVAEPPPLSPATLAAVRAGTTVPAEASGRSPAYRRWTLAAAAAVVALAAGAAGLAVGASFAGEPPVGETVAVRAADAQVQASARLVPHTWGMEVRLVASGFAAGRTYRVSVTDDAGRTVGAGEFIGTGEVEMRCNLNSSVLRADASSFTVSDASGRVLIDAAI